MSMPSGKKSVLILFSSIAMLAASASAVTYLKADAPEGGDGTTWATAFRGVEEAVRAAAAGDGVVYAAGGVYVVTDKMLPADGFKIYGGFAGLSDDETPDGRDVEQHQTILTGDRALDDYWAHVVPVFGEYRMATTELAQEKVLSDGAVNFPPPYSGDFDCYQPVIPNKDDNSACAFSIGAGVSSAYDGLWFTGFRDNGNDGNCFDIKQNAGVTVINDCRFVGNRTNHGQIGDNAGKARITRCQFRFSMTTSRASGVSSRGRTEISDCLFESLPRLGCNGGGVIFFWSGGPAAVRRCVFTRCLNVATSWGEGNYGGPANIVSSEAGSGFIADCVVSNTFSASAYLRGTPLVALKANTIRGTSFINNRYEVKPVDGRVYTLIGAPLGDNYQLGVLDCTFRGNVIAAPAVAATSGGYVLGIVGNSGDGHKLSVVNCTFDSNRAECADVPGVVPVLSRALVDHAPVLNKKTNLGVMNCTFAGPAEEGVYDIVQSGPAHQCALTVVNSVFMTDGADVAAPFHVVSPSLFKIVDCTIKNWIEPQGGLAAEDLQYDEIPFVREDEATVSHVPVLVPAAKTPGLREGADVATNAVSDLAPTFRYRPVGSESWFALVPLAGGAQGGDAAPAADANGTVRPFGAVTRGATQPIDGAAEEGVTLTLRREPLLGGAFSSPSTQAVLAGQPIVPVTATPLEGGSFLGWYKEDGTLFSESAVLEIPALDADLILTARFETPVRSVTFDLGVAGTFDENGQPTISVPARQGEAFPAVPAFTMSTEWFVDGWAPAFPAFVPGSNTTFRADYVTRDVRVVHVVPRGEKPEGSDGSGSSWANASDDLAAAYREAGRYRGELWLKGGLYTMRKTIDGLPNVTVRGGFAGNETTAAAADPSAYETIVSGDVNGDTYWKPNGTDPQAAFRTNLWVDGRFSEPNPSGADDFWQPSGNSSDDSAIFFRDKDVDLADVSFEGLTFTSFRTGVLSLARDSSAVAFRRCRFLANATAGAYNQGGVLYLQKGRVEIEDCDFVGNYHVATFLTSAGREAGVIRNCRFRENYSTGMGACFRLEGNAGILVEDCDFYRNCGKSEAFRNAAVLSFYSSGPSTMRGCLFRENRTRGTGYGVINKDLGGSLLLEACRFLGNDAANTAGGDFQSACIAVFSGKLMARDCYFDGNRISVGGQLGAARYGAVVSTCGGESQFLNCTMTGNIAEDASTANPGVGILAGSAPMAFVHCLVDDSRLIGGACECIPSATDANTTFAMIDTVVRNGAADYAPFRFYSPNMTLSLADTAVSRLDVASLPTGGNGYLYDVSDNPGPVSSTRLGPAGLPARGVAAASPYVRAGRPVWLAPDGYLYLYDEAANPSQPWRKVVKKTSYSGSVAGLTTESPLVPDAFGAARTIGRVSYGPLVAPSSGTFLLLR